MSGTHGKLSGNAGSDTYRSVIASSAPPVSTFVDPGPSSKTTQHEKFFAHGATGSARSGSGSSGSLQKRESSVILGGCAGPVLPVDLERFPVQPNFAILQGEYSACLEAVLKALTDKGAGFVVERVDREEGLVYCSLDSVKDSAFNLALWQLPQNQLLLELIVLSTESNHSWGDTLDRLCSHGATRQLVMLRQHALNAAQTFTLGGGQSIGNFVVKPVF